jgi:hypothetical protein
LAESRPFSSIGLVAKRVLNSQRPKLLAVLKIFTEKKRAIGILGCRYDQRIVRVVS